MTKKIQLCYSSKHVEMDTTLLEDLSDILNTARAFNSKTRVYGVLYYAQGYFFQCLQGKDSAVKALYERIKQDPRHNNVTLLEIKPIEKNTFKRWSMKYVKENSVLNNFFNSLDSGFFDPENIKETQLVQFLNAALSEPDEPINTKYKTGFKNRGQPTFL